MEYYLVIEYLPRGSLYDFLHDALLSTQEGIRLVLSLASGLDYLHSEIKSSIAKPSIAHRDLKSKNVLVKNTGKGFQCCIADFGLAARSDFFDNLPDKSTFNYQVGTRRYMAPEILDSSIKLASFESLRKADMYMFGLIAWEISHRMGGNARPYQYPYQNEVPGDPSITEMKTVVVDQGRRPQLPVWWEGDGSLAELSHITRECWDREPSVRLTSLRVRKNLARLSDRRVIHRDSGCYLTDNSDHGSSGQTTSPDAGIQMT